MSDVPETVVLPEGVAEIPLEVVETRVGAFGVSGSPDGGAARCQLQAVWRLVR